MALKKKVIQDDGVTTEYHRIQYCKQSLLYFRDFSDFRKNQEETTCWRDSATLSENCHL